VRGWGEESSEEREVSSLPGIVNNWIFVGGGKRICGSGEKFKTAIEKLKSLRDPKGEREGSRGDELPLAAGGCSFVILPASRGQVTWEKRRIKIKKILRGATGLISKRRDAKLNGNKVLCAL